jgi:hypothetical protein
LSKNTSVVLWLIIASIGRISTPWPRFSRKFIRNTESPSVRRLTSATGVVRANSSIRSEWRARDVHTFWPLTT